VEAQLLDELGLRADVAVELEFYLVSKKNDRAGWPLRAINPATGQPEQDPQVYNVGVYHGFEPLLREIERCCQAQGLDVEGSVCEFGGGQFEVNLRHGIGASKVVHETVALMRTVRRVAARQGLRATFMSKPFDGDAGNGMHLHTSLVDSDGQNVFAGTEVGTALKHAIGGLMETLFEAMLIFAPSAHAWRRLEPHMFVPMGKFWAVENRSVLVRVPQLTDQDKRIEHRVAGAEANPYFATAAVLAGIHHGLKQQIDPGPEATGNASLDWQAGMPRNFLDALEAHQGSQILRPLIGEEIWDRYYKVKRAELVWYLRERTPIEARWYLSSLS
jgi:glutamine synthetase